MKFTVNTKPLVEGLNLAIVNANVSKYYLKSTMAQLKVVDGVLVINIEAASILSEVRLKGMVEDASSAIAFVDSMVLKQLVSTFETATVIFDFAENGLVLQSGKSKFTLPYMVEADDEEDGMEFETPSTVGTSDWVEVDKTGWKFVKDYQMFAIAMSFFHKVYTLVFTDNKGNVIVGDYDNGIFTHSKKLNLGKTCLIADTIVNLFNNLPDGAVIAENNDNYLISVHTDSFDYTAEFIPEYESNPEFGSYNSQIIINMMNSDVTGIKVDSGIINKILNQAALLSSASEDKIDFIVSGKSLVLKDKNIDCSISSSTESPIDYSITFKTALFKPMISNLSEEEVEVRPLVDYDESGNFITDDAGNIAVNGVLFINKDMKSVIAGADQ